MSLQSVQGPANYVQQIYMFICKADLISTGATPCAALALPQSKAYATPPCPGPGYLAVWVNYPTFWEQVHASGVNVSGKIRPKKFNLLGLTFAHNLSVLSFAHKSSISGLRKSASLDLTERNAVIPSYCHLPVSCRCLVDRCGSLWSCKPQIIQFTLIVI